MENTKNRILAFASLGVPLSALSLQLETNILLKGSMAFVGASLSVTALVLALNTLREKKAM